MKKTTTAHRKTKRLALQRDIIRELTTQDLGRAGGGMRDNDVEMDRCPSDEPIRPCHNPIYSA